MMSLRQLFLAIGGLWLYLTVFSLPLSAGFANTASYTHYVFQATTPVSIPSMPSEPPHSEDRISVSWQSPPVIYKALPVRWLLSFSLSCFLTISLSVRDAVNRVCHLMKDLAQ